MVFFETRRPWNPLFDARRIQDEFDRFFQRSGMGARAAHPRVDVYSGEKGVVLTAELPGVRAEDIEVRVERDTLTLRGRYPTEELAEGGRVLRRERPQGEFERSFQLPFHADADSVRARFTHGVLQVGVDRPAEQQPRRIQVQTEG